MKNNSNKNKKNNSNKNKKNKKNNKKNKVKKEKKQIEYRNKEERQNEIKTILEQLNNFSLNNKYEAIRHFFSLAKDYINNDRRIEVNIPFPEIGRRIKGLLARSKNEETWINLKVEK